MKFDYRRFDDYEKFTDYLNSLGVTWKLHSWQDVGGDTGIDIRALFMQNRTSFSDPLPEAK